MWGMALCAWLAGKRSVYTFHSVFPTRRVTYLYHCLLRWSAKYIFNCRFQTISDSVYDHELHFYHNPTTKIYNWYGSNRFYPATEGEKIQVRHELNIPPDTLVLISVGGCDSNKRHSEILKALPEIIKHVPNCLYLHLGKGESEEEEKALTLQLGISEYVRFYGNQTNVRKYLIASDIYLMTSRYEGISITTIEAMACGIPSILYDVSGLRDFNKTGENSVLISEDYRILAEKIIFLYSHPRIATMISFNAQALVNSTFNMKTNVSQIFRLYQPYYEI
jgi:glycosyltransferase involved in cell wall biosynthesis